MTFYLTLQLPNLNRKDLKMARTNTFGVGRLPLKVREAFPQAETVSDSTTPIVLTVTAKDRRRAITQDPSACAMARACEREQHADGAWIGLSVSYLLSGTHLTRYRTPQSVAREIVTFDRHHDFDPGTYSLASMPPSQSHRLGAHTRPSTKTTGATKGRAHRVPHHRTLNVRGAK